MYGKQRKAGFCENKNNSQVSDDDEDDEEDKYNPKGVSRFSPPAFVRRLCMKIYVDISNGSYKSAETLTKKAEEVLKFCVDGKLIGADHEEGYNYVIRSLQIYFSLSKEVEGWDKKKITSSVDYLNSYHKLCDKSKAAVISVKSYFYRNLYSDESYEEQIAVCRQLCELERDNFEWHVDLCRIIFKEHSKNVKCGLFSPSADEIAAITAAVECPRAENEPYVMAFYLFTLARKLHQQVRSGVSFPLAFGSEVFREEKHMVEFIRSEAERVMAINPTCSYSCCQFRKIFNMILPAKWQDLNFALVCAKRNQIFFPDSHSGNHGLAAMSTDMGDFEKAEEYLLKAHRAEKRDHWATFDLLYLWLRNATNNRVKFDQMFNDYVDSPRHANNKGLMARLKLVKGIQLCLLNSHDEAAQFFLGAFSNDDTQTLKELKDLPRRAQRYGLDELDALIRNGGLGQLFCRFANDSSRPRSLNDRKTFKKLSEGSPVNSGPKNRREPKKIISSLNTENDVVEALTVLNLESDVHAAYERAVKSCNPEKYWELSDEDLEKQVKKMRRINKAWEVLYIHLIEYSSRQ